MKSSKYTFKHHCLLSILVTGLALPMIGHSQDASTQQASPGNTQNQQADTKSKDGQQVDLGNYTDGSFVTLRGTVESVSPNAFTLSYNNDEQVTVEMDDGDRDADAYVLLPGDKVTVTGLIDRDLFETRKIEAGSVYVDKLNTYFMSSAIDEEDYSMFTTIVAIEPIGDAGADSSTSSSRSASDATSSASAQMPLVWLQGEVSSVNDNTLKLAMGDNELTISTDKLSSNPLDDYGYPKIESGDIVQVSGRVDSDFLDSGELEANSILKIHDKENI